MRESDFTNVEVIQTKNLYNFQKIHNLKQLQHKLPSLQSHMISLNIVQAIQAAPSIIFRETRSGVGLTCIFQSLHAPNDKLTTHISVKCTNVQGTRKSDISKKHKFCSKYQRKFENSKKSINHGMHKIFRSIYWM